MKRTALFNIAIMLLIAHLSFSQGRVIEEFHLKNIFTGNYVSLNDYKGKNIIVIIFTSNYCPYSKYYEARITKLSKAYEDRNVQFLLINSNNSEVNKLDGFEELSKTAKDKQYNFPYLIDSDQQYCSRLGAKKTPEAFVYENLNGKFCLKYSGAIDDNPQMESQVSQHFLKESIESILNKNILSYNTSRPTGCMIKDK